jgi:DNA-binding transcriptional MerR regulator
MKGKPLKIHDLALHLGLPEEDVQTLVEEYANVIPSRVLGRVRLYDESAIAVIRRIQKFTADGLDGNEIARKMGRSPRVVRGKPEPHPKEPDPGTETHRIAVITEPERIPPSLERRFTGLRETNALQATQIKSLVRRVENLEENLARTQRELASAEHRIEELLGVIRQQAAVADEWIDYFASRSENFEKGQVAQLERIREWIAFFENELDEMKKPFFKKLYRK